ncbi:hypothetical protein [Flavobacterium sp.]|jgi:hypothetical protein|uniref:hypothetical protein n=1 Tax=Flavobacterium sp. TaxID=239 RepID=UPI0037BE393A
MISLESNTKIYMFCPANFETGGTELAHQLVDYLITNNKESYIVYYENNKIIDANIPEGFKKYKIHVKTEIEDNINNIIVLPEVSFSFIKNYNNIQFVFWWMSVDNFYYKSTFLDYIKFFNLYNSLKLIYSRLKNNQSIFKGFSLKTLKQVKNNNLHVYQSTYAKLFLLENGFKEILPLSDYINSEFTTINKSEIIKENIILYNPAKGLNITKKIIRKLPDYNFVPLANLSRNQLTELFVKAKVYIDFGSHPGKDRMPREAVIHNCCIIVGNKGSAKYFEDVPIFNKYKENESNIENIVAIVKYSINNYYSINENFDFYRKRVMKEKIKFHQEINEIFDINH